MDAWIWENAVMSIRMRGVQSSKHAFVFMGFKSISVHQR